MRKKAEPQTRKHPNSSRDGACGKGLIATGKNASRSDREECALDDRSHRTLIPALAAVLSVGGCLPIPRTMIVAPLIRGDYQHKDGRPIDGAQVVVSTAHGDSACARSVASTTTDAAGQFALPATTYRESFVLLLPMDVIYGFQVCVGSADSLYLVYRGQALGGYGNPATLVLNCVNEPGTEPQDSAQVVCNGW